MAERAPIELRLMHLLNDSQSPDPTPKELPIHTAPARGSGYEQVQYSFLPPLEVDSSNGHRRANAVPQHIPSLHPIADDVPPRQSTRPDGPYRSQAAATTTTSVLPPFQQLDDPESVHLPAFRLGYSTDTNDDAATKKRQRALTLRQDHSGPLPQPLKKQKSTQQVVPPIISGLHEPPRDAAVLPPMVGAYDDVHASTHHAAQDFAPAQADLPFRPSSTDLARAAERLENRGKERQKRTAIKKKRRKWSEEETNDLLRGVQKHGMSNWTKIVNDPEYSFIERNAGDLKDRFRTICPKNVQKELEQEKGSGQEGQVGGAQPQPKTTMPIDNILNEDILDDDWDTGAKKKGSSSVASTSNDSDGGGAAKPKTRAHRKNIEDLQALGIERIQPSDRRPRRPFTEKEDADILDGIREHGASWTRIQGDSRYGLKLRKPIDLRDRIRNKYPDLYKSLEKGTSASILAGRTTTRILEPSFNTPGWDGHSTLEPHLNRAHSSENMSGPRLPPLHASSSGPPEPVEYLSRWTPSFDVGDTPPSSFTTTGDEMSISRLTHLDTGDSQSSREHHQGYPGGIDEWPTAVAATGGRTTEQQPAAEERSGPLGPHPRETSRDNRSSRNGYSNHAKEA